ncbi:sensor histidine kinase [Streptomyces sp. NPDC091040]|uniref:sensor histidine kinase n=1 Tax=Streptomyces sp. NPDC091040 TaxID=3365972 RepID=UPI00381D14D1
MNETITGLLSGMSVGAAALSAMWFAIRQYRRADERTYELGRSIEEMREILRLQGYEVSEAVRSQRLVPELLERLPDEIAFRVWQDTKRRTQLVTNVTADVVHLSSADVSGERARLTQEIAHSLGTPLAQIEAAALSMESLSVGGDETAERAVRRIREGVEICKCFINAYRNYGTLQKGVGESFTGTGADALIMALDFYSDAAGKPIAAEVGEMPESFVGYSNDFVIAALLPLLENAVDASPERGRIAVNFARRPDAISFTISNKCASGPPGSEVFDRGYTTKSGHQGVGLSVSKGLIEGYAGGEITMDVDGDEVTFTVALPFRREEDGDVLGTGGR